MIILCTSTQIYAILPINQGLFIWREEKIGVRKTELPLQRYDSGLSGCVTGRNLLR